MSRITEAQAERLHDLRACGPLSYRPGIDRTLIHLGLAELWEPGEPQYGVTSTPDGEDACDDYYRELAEAAYDKLNSNTKL